MTPTECKELLAEVKNALRDELDSNDFSFDLGFNEQSFPEQSRELALDNDLTAEVSFRAEGHRHIDRGDYYTPPEEHGEITISITHVDFYDINGDKVAEHDAPWPSCYDKQNTIKLTF